MDDGTALEAVALTKRYGGTVALDGVTFDVRRGEFFAVVGPSGCGKTTMLRLIAGLDGPDSGSLRIGGADASRQPPWKREVNTVFQHYALFPHMSVFDNIAYGPRSAGWSRERVARAVSAMLASTRLEGYERRKPAQLSGGEQQRVALARALINRPTVLLLDEPLGALDLELRHAMRSELKRIQRELAVAFVHVTHDQEEALSLADRVAVMRAGRIEQNGAPADVYARPANRFVASFVGGANLLPGTVVSAGEGRCLVELGPRRRTEAGCAEGIGVHDRVLVVVRPESVRLVPEHTPGAIGARVTERFFEGAAARLVLRARDGTELVARTPDAEAGVQDVFVTWDERAAWAVRE